MVLSLTAKNCWTKISNKNFESKLGTEYEFTHIFIGMFKETAIFRCIYMFCYPRFFIDTPKSLANLLHHGIGILFLLLLPENLICLCLMDDPSFIQPSSTLLNLLSWLDSYH